MTTRLMLSSLACGALLWAAGCATPIHPDERLRSDYSVEPVGPATFRIQYLGEEPATAERVVDLALLRACEVTRARGARYFALVDQARTTRERIVFDDAIQPVTLDPERGLVIRCFALKPKDTFVFRARSLQAMLWRRTTGQAPESGG